MARFHLYTIGYRDAETDARKPPEKFYRSLPKRAVVLDIRSHPYSPFAREYTGRGVREAVERWKKGKRDFLHLRALGNTRRDSAGKRLSPPIYVDEAAGFAELEKQIRAHISVVIFCACSPATFESPTHRCHRFFVAEELKRRIPKLNVIHLPKSFRQFPQQPDIKENI